MMRINAEQGVVESKVCDGTNHVAMVSGFVCFLKNKAPILDDIVDFFQRNEGAYDKDGRAR